MRFNTTQAVNTSTTVSSSGQAAQTYPAFFSKENIPIFALLVASCALCFQLGVLAPWHPEISNQFNMFKEKAQLLRNTSLEIRKKMENIIAVGVDIRQKEKKILSMESEIENLEDKILAKIDEIKKAKTL